MSRSQALWATRCRSFDNTRTERPPHRSRVQSANVAARTELRRFDGLQVQYRDLDVDENGNGGGTVYYAVKLKFNKSGQLELKHYAQSPGRIAQATLMK